jgi:TolA-binding protein
MHEALRIYREMSGEDHAIPPLVHMQIGKAAAKARDWEVAAHAFKHVASGRSEHAGTALVSLAQVIGDGQKDLAWAKKLYHQAIERYPQTPVAVFAQQRLTAMGE